MRTRGVVWVRVKIDPETLEAYRKVTGRGRLRDIRRDMERRLRLWLETLTVISDDTTKPVLTVKERKDKDHE